VSDQPLVIFTPSGRRGRFPVGTSVLNAARTLGVDIESICGGRGICRRCQVVLVTGEFSKHGIVSSAGHLSPRSEAELRHIQRGQLADERRLSCAACLSGDVVIDVPEESQVHRQVVRKAVDEISIELDPAIRLYYVEVQQPDMDAPASDLQRLLNALKQDWNLTSLECDLHVVQSLQACLRAAEWKITVAIHAGATIIAIWPGFRPRAFGMALDAGSTTVAAHLCDLSTGEVVAAAGCMNPQIRFGEDLMSRVSYIMMHPEGVQELTAAIRGAVNELAKTTAAEAGIEVSEILDITVVGNPVMHHLMLGINPLELGGAPFALATDRPMTVRASELGVALHAGSRAFILPCIAGHVGADAAAMVLAERPDLREELTVLVDVGTNAEIILGNRARLLACSSPTGPAFEGAQISCGQRAAPGAIERVRIDPETFEPRVKVVGCDLWSDDPGFKDATAKSAVTGLCGSGIIEAIAEMFLVGIVRQDGTIDGRLAARCARVRPDGPTFSYMLYEGATPLSITQNDVRAIQLAKAALHAGIRLLMDRMGVDAVERIRLAGAFGSHIDVKYAMVLGMLPDCDLGQVTSAGNAAGSGARVALLNKEARGLIETLVRRIEKVETAIEPRFQFHFVEAMALPHYSASYPNLARVVTLPARDSGDRPRKSGSRRMAGRTNL
jgi:uncharacterized 2Fe-2S/4Fe-4S cluster protein (DUF4445 family)